MIKQYNYYIYARSRPGDAGLHLCFFRDDVVLLALLG